MLLLRSAVLLSLVSLTVSAQTTAPPCTGLCLQQVQCPAGGSTTVSGTVLAPNGKDPIPNVTVYIPNATVDPLSAGISCPAPGQLPSGSPLVGAFTAADGSFTLNNVPVGNNIPIVILAGKWRRQLTIPSTTACSNTAFNARFPRNQSEGDIPKFAVSSASADVVECVLRKVGIDDAEFTNPAGTGRVQFYQANGSPGARIDTTTPATGTLIADQTALNSYDILMLPCEGGSYDEPAAQLANLVNYANGGGRIYGSHFAYEWLYKNPPFNTVVNWAGNAINYGSTSMSATVDPTFPGGATLSKWLQVVGASTTPGKIDVSVVRKDFTSINPPTQSWITLDQTGATIQLTFATPVGQTSGQCGRVLFNEYHVENPASTPKNLAFPTECPVDATKPNGIPDMTSQEKLLEYSLFDLANNGGPATISPSNADFGNVAVGFTSSPQTFTVRNNSVFTAALSTSGISGDFLITGNTCSSVVAGGTCTIQVVFRPGDLGPRTGSLSINFGGTDLTVPLTGTGIAPLAISTSALDFGNVDVGFPLGKTVTISNVAPGPVALSSLAISGDFQVATSCPSVLPAGSNCPLFITFTPSVTGSRSGKLTATGIATALTGNGVDFSIATSPGNGSVIAGLPKTFTSTVSPIAGFAAPVTLSCSTNAPGTTCSIANNAFTPSSAVTTNVALTTTSQYTVIGYGVTNNLLLVSISAAAGLLLFRKRAKGGKLLSGAVLFVAGGLACLYLTGCSGKLPDQNAGYTPTGAYTFTVTATDGFLVHSATYQLTVTAK